MPHKPTDKERKVLVSETNLDEPYLDKETEVETEN